MAQAQIISAYAEGHHNAAMEQTIRRLDQEHSYKDLSTIVIVPGFGSVNTRCFSTWWSMYSPPNQKVARFFPENMEVGDAYSVTLENILAHPELSKYKYVLFLEHDHSVPPDGMVKLLAHAENNPQFAGIGGLYFVRGPNGPAQIWGDINDHVLNFRPQKPDPNGGLVECNGLGNGFTLFRLEMFKDPKLRRPWFKTTNGSTGEGLMTQDLYFASDARKHGYRFAVACDCKVGHVDLSTGFVW